MIIITHLIQLIYSKIEHYYFQVTHDIKIHEHVNKQFNGKMKCVTLSHI